MPFNIGISHSETCMNVDCLRQLSSYELNKQTEKSIRYFFCIKCRTQGMPKYKFVNVLCVDCNKNLVRIATMMSSFVCQECIRNRRVKKELGKQNFDARYKKVLEKEKTRKRRWQYRVMDTLN